MNRVVVIGLAVVLIGGAATRGNYSDAGEVSTACEYCARDYPGMVDISTVRPSTQWFGTGIVFSADGDVLTNDHVVAGAQEINVVDLRDGSSHRATVVGEAPEEDLAVVHVQDVSGWSVARFGDSDLVRVGDRVVAVGNNGEHMAAEGSVTATRVTQEISDTFRRSDETLVGLLRVSALVVPGDSGGPLVNAAGEVIGVDVAASDTAPVGFAIPINRARGVAARLTADNRRSA